MIWEIATLTLYGLGLLWFSTALEHEDGKQGPIIVLSLFWPLFVIYVLINGGMDDDDTAA